MSRRGLEYHFWWPTWGGRKFFVLSELANLDILRRTRQRRRTLEEELVAAGYDPDELRFPGSFAPSRELTPSPLSELSDSTASPRSTAVEPGSEEEVEDLIRLTMAPTTRSKLRAQQAPEEQSPDPNPLQQSITDPAPSQLLQAQASTSANTAGPA